MTIWLPDECAVFYRTRDRFGELSNMAGGMPIRYGSRVYPSSEALYQALRYPDRLDLHDAIIRAPSAFASKRKAYEFKDETRSDWQDVKVSTMEMVLRLKLEQHYVKMQSVLDQTLDMPIVERSSKDNFWGAIPDSNGVLRGENVLGILWIIVRDE
jgi:ribA/ribD-fused uncharacterized protein